MANPKSKKSNSPTAITDIAHPGTSSPSDTSKPIITQRPIMKDPMVVDNGSDISEGEEKPTPLKKIGETKITPLSKKTEAKSDVDESNGSDEPDTAEPVSEQGTQPKAESDTKAEAKPEAEPIESEASASDSDTGDAPEDGKKPKKPDTDAEAAIEAEQDGKTQKLIDDKKYFLPINAVEHRRSTRFVAIGIILALILAVAWIDVALDAGLIHLGSVKPVTHFFSN